MVLAAWHEGLSGYTWVAGRLTKIQQTQRPGHIWPEMWSRMSKSQKRQSKAEWETIRSQRDELRQNRQIHFVSEEDIADYNHHLARTREQLSLPSVPAMPCIQGQGSNQYGGTSDGATLALLLFASCV